MEFAYFIVNFLSYIGCYWTVDLSNERQPTVGNQIPSNCPVKTKRKRQTLTVISIWFWIILTSNKCDCLTFKTIKVPSYCPEKHPDVHKPFEAYQVEQTYYPTAAPVFCHATQNSYNILPTGYEHGNNSTARDYEEFVNYHYSKEYHHFNTLPSIAPLSTTSSIIESAARSAGITLDEDSNKHQSIPTQTYYHSEPNTLQEISTYVMPHDFIENLEPSVTDFDWDLLIN